eukprot:gene59123-78889_t
MFVFEDLLKLDGKSVQLVLKEVSTDSLVVSLKGATNELRELVLANMSSRAAEALREDLESRGPMRLSEVEAQQKEILKIVRRLSDEGQIMLGGGGGRQLGPAEPDPCCPWIIMANKPNTHSRFIPREEIEGVAAWHFSAVDGSDEHLHANAGDKSEGVTSEVLQEARQQAYAEGFERGHEAGGQEVRDALEATVRKTAEETAVRMAQLLHNTKDNLHKSEEKIS